MKKLLYSSVVMLLFSFSIILFQVSCQKEATADKILVPGAIAAGIPATQINKVIFSKITQVYNGMKLHTPEIWLCNYDGTGATKVNIVLPNGIGMDGNDPQFKLSPDGQKIFFLAGPLESYLFPSLMNGRNKDLYVCNVDGTNIKLIAQGVNGWMVLGGAY